MSATADLERLLRDAPLPLIASRIKKARKSAGLSHDRLGEAAGGIYRANLINLEHGRHRPKLETLVKIAAATERDVTWFLEPEVAPSSPFRPDSDDGDG